MVPYFKTTMPIANLCDRIVTYTRRGDIICECDESHGTMQPTYMQYSIPRKWKSPYTVSSDLHSSFDLSVPTRRIPIPVSYNMHRTSCNDRYFYHVAEIPYHQIPVPMSVLIAYPDATVYKLYRSNRHSDSDGFSGYCIQRNDADFYCSDFPTWIQVSAEGTSNFGWANEHGLHSEHGPALVTIEYANRNVLRELGDKLHNGLTREQIRDAWFFISDKIIDTNKDWQYWNNGRNIPQELIVQQIIDPMNFDPIVDTFTLDMHKPSGTTPL